MSHASVSRTGDSLLAEHVSRVVPVGKFRDAAEQAPVPFLLRTTSTRLTDEDIAQLVSYFRVAKDPVTERQRSKQSTPKPAEVAKSHFQSVFISYGGPDEAVARMIYEALKASGIETFFFPESSVPGEKLHRTMSDGVNQYEKVLLICSKDSLVRPGVLNEIERVLEREASEGGSDLLLPVTIDSYIYNEWQPQRSDVKRQICSRVVGDFRNTVGDSSAFLKAMARVLSALVKKSV